MPKNGRSKGKSRKDNKQDARIRALEEMVNKTIEMKQVNYQQSNISLPSSGFSAGSFLQVATGAEDGAGLGSAARVGNSITLMRQQVCLNITGSGTDTWNQCRVIMAESVDGNQPLALTDILEYGAYALYGETVFCSPYTTKTSTNKRYKIHYDKAFVLSGLPTKGGVPPAKVIKHTVRYGKSGKELEYAGAGSLNPNNHRLTIFIVTDSVSASHPELHYAVRSSYKDA